jgi:hypothetical protein
MSHDQAPPHKASKTIECGKCGAEPRLVHKFLDIRNGGTLRMYKCQCGEQMWVHYPE